MRTMFQMKVIASNIRYMYQSIICTYQKQSNLYHYYIWLLTSEIIHLFIIKEVQMLFYQFMHELFYSQFNILVIEQLLMGQQEIKRVKNNQLQTIQNLPLPLKTFGLLIKTAKLQKISDKQFVLNKGIQNQFIIKTNKPTPQLIEYQGFAQIYTKDNKKIFAGKVNKMLRQGFGIQFDEKQRIFYRGEFANDLYDGWGQTLKYQGEFKNGKKDGWGKWTESTTNIDYEGFFKDDKFNGMGYLNIETSQINKFMAEDKVIDPAQKVTMKFAGEWLNGKMHGNGKLSTKQQAYKGGFNEGLYEGQGILTKNGNSKKGKFSNGILIKPI